MQIRHTHGAYCLLVVPHGLSARRPAPCHASKTSPKHRTRVQKPPTSNQQPHMPASDIMLLHDVDTHAHTEVWMPGREAGCESPAQRASDAQRAPRMPLQ